MADKRCAVFIVQGSKSGTGRPEQPLLFSSLIHITHHIIHTHRRSREERERGKHRESKGSQEREQGANSSKCLEMHVVDRKYEIKEQFLFHTTHHVLSFKPFCMMLS